MRSSEQPWPYQELRFQGGENQDLNRFISAFGRGANGNVYGLASSTRWASPKSRPRRRKAGAAENETIGNETAAANETTGNETGAE